MVMSGVHIAGNGEDPIVVHPQQHAVADVLRMIRHVCQRSNVEEVTEPPPSWAAS